MFVLEPQMQPQSLHPRPLTHTDPGQTTGKSNAAEWLEVQMLESDRLGHSTAVWTKGGNVQGFDEGSTDCSEVQ